MSINNVKAVGDDQDWKAQAETEISKLREDVDYLLRQLEQLTKRVNQ